MKSGKISQNRLFCHFDEELGQEISIRHFQFEKDWRLLHEWMQMRHIAPFWKLDVPVPEFKAYLNRSLGNPHRNHYLIFFGDRPVSYGMTYAAKEELIASYYDYEPEDLGGHFVVGPREFLDRRYICPIVCAILTHAFQTTPAKRLVVEPDVRNRIVVPALKECGFEDCGRVQLPHKKAVLMICRREAFTGWLLHEGK